MKKVFYLSLLATLCFFTACSYDEELEQIRQELEEIKEKIEKCLASPQQVLDLYKDFNRANKDLSKKQMKDYLEM